MKRIFLFMDKFQILVNPVALGEGTSLFTGLPKKAALTLIEARQFQSGAMLLTYKPAESSAKEPI
jgi:dihydrofolate reductase